jgi:hypothetical protein
MSFLIVGAIGVAAGAAKAISGGIQKKKAKEAQAAAQAELDANKQAFMGLDTSNPYKNMENTMEDLTVNQKEAEFMKQQQQQSQANILSSMKGSAGGSGIAALAQTMANQGAMDAQRSAVSIGKQESANQMAERQEASRLQGLEREGDIMSRNQEAQKAQMAMGMSADQVAAEREAVSAADEKMWAGISSAASAAGGAVGNAGGVGNLLGGTS